MASINKVILIGNLGRDPEVRYTPGGAAVANFTLATNEAWTGKDGKKEERTEWHRVVCWNRIAELCGEYLSKGRPVYVEGRLQTREWEDKDGHKRQTTEIIANTIQFLGGMGERGERSERQSFAAAGGGAGRSAGRSRFPLLDGQMRPVLRAPPGGRAALGPRHVGRPRHGFRHVASLRRGGRVVGHRLPLHPGHYRDVGVASAAFGRPD